MSALWFPKSVQNDLTDSLKVFILQEIPLPPVDIFVKSAALPTTTRASSNQLLVLGILLLSSIVAATSC